MVDLIWISVEFVLDMLWNLDLILWDSRWIFVEYKVFVEFVFQVRMNVSLSLYLCNAWSVRGVFISVWW